MVSCVDGSCVGTNCTVPAHTVRHLHIYSSHNKNKSFSCKNPLGVDNSFLLGCDNVKWAVLDRTVVALSCEGMGNGCSTVMCNGQTVQVILLALLNHLRWRNCSLSDNHTTHSNSRTPHHSHHSPNAITSPHTTLPTSHHITSHHSPNTTTSHHITSHHSQHHNITSHHLTPLSQHHNITSHHTTLPTPQYHITYTTHLLQQHHIPGFLNSQQRHSNLRSHH
jgi:hypothetical protein